MRDQNEKKKTFRGERTRKCWIQHAFDIFISIFFVYARICIYGSVWWKWQVKQIWRHPKHYLMWLSVWTNETRHVQFNLVERVYVGRFSKWCWCEFAWNRLILKMDTQDLISNESSDCITVSNFQTLCVAPWTGAKSFFLFKRTGIISKSWNGIFLVFFCDRIF